MKPTYKGYTEWLTNLKSKIRSVQIKAAIAINAELIGFYWELGKMLSEKEQIWGSKLVEQVAKDLQMAFPDMKGLSRSNLYNTKKFYQFYQDEIVQQPVGQIPWGHNILIFTKSKTQKEAEFYIEQTIRNGWSRDSLAFQMKSDLFNRKGKAVSNFKKTLPASISELAQQTLKDPYVFDFMTTEPGFKEKDIEKQLVQHMTRFLLELGKGFAFVGQQYLVRIADNDYYLDLLFYHIRLRCYVVIELKNNRFIPEYAGKLNFYLSAVDSMIKEEEDKPTIGILLCRDKTNIEAEFSLRDINKPMGISEFQITEILPENLKSSFPTIEELENELKSWKP